MANQHQVLNLSFLDESWYINYFRIDSCSRKEVTAYKHLRFFLTVENLFTKVSFELLILNFSVLVLSKQKHMNDMETTREIFWTS
jgi:hypothetical protein